MVRSLLPGLIVAVGATVGQLPSGDGQSATSQQAPSASVQAQPSNDVPSVVPPSTKDPFRNVFQTARPTPPDPDVLASLAKQVAANTQVVCGLTMWQVDPNTDPKIRPSVPSASGQKPSFMGQPDFKIRRIIPTVCRE